LRILASLICAAVLGIGLASAQYWVLPIPPQGRVPDEVIEPARDLSPASCGLCHRKQYREWSGSRHAAAAGGGVLGQLPAFDPETRTSCLGCHAPSSEQQDRLDAADPGRVRSLSGVDCVACHVRGHRRHSAAGKSVTPHGRVVAEPLFEDVTFCSPCHQFPEWGERVNGKLLENTEQEWRASPAARAGISCQDCHMPDGSHKFKGIHDPEMSRRALQPDVRRDRQGLRIRVRNSGAGHALPTYAPPRIRVILRGGDPHAAERIHGIQRRLRWDPDQGWEELADTRLLPGQELRLALELEPDEDAEAVLLVEPDALYHEQVYPYLLESIGEDLDPDSLQMLRDARDQAGRTGFVLYRARCSPWAGQPIACPIEPQPPAPRFDTGR